MITFELFHELADRSSARVRLYVVENYLEDAVVFRNIAFDEHRDAWRARGGTMVPALWDGDRLFEGAEAAIARLQVLTNIGRAP